MAWTLEATVAVEGVIVVVPTLGGGVMTGEEEEVPGGKMTVVPVVLVRATRGSLSRM